MKARNAWNPVQLIVIHKVVCLSEYLNRGIANNRSYDICIFLKKWLFIITYEGIMYELKTVVYTGLFMISVGRQKIFFRFIIL